MLPRPHRLAAPLALAGALGTFFAAGSARAQVLVSPTFTFTGSAYHYSYAVTNLSSDDLPIIDLNGLPLDPTAATNLSAPTGYQISFDPGVGILSFLPGLANGQTFGAGSTVSDFSFDSAFAPAAVSFDTTGDPTSPAGTTLGPAGAPVPEASTFVSLGIGLSLLAFAVVRRRRSAAVQS